MSNIQVQFRRGTTTQHSSFTGAVGEVTVDTDLDTLRVHDGSTAGGVRLAKHSELGGLADGSVTTAKIADDAVTNAKIASGAVGSTEISVNAVGQAAMQNNSVGTAELIDDNVTFAKMQNINTATVIGRTSASSGDPEEVSILDEDTMSSDSATALATQQSIKAYVDSQVGSGSTRSWSTFTEGTGTGQRSLNTEYTNNTGAELEVYFTGQYQPTHTGQRLFSFQVKIGTSFVDIDYYNLASSNVRTVNSVGGTVPNGVTYKISASTSGLSFIQWAELSV